jgi:hypothetical protein
MVKKERNPSKPSQMFSPYPYFPSKKGKSFQIIPHSNEDTKGKRLKSESRDGSNANTGKRFAYLRRCSPDK